MLVAFEGDDTTYPTDDGRRLSFGDEEVQGRVHLRFDPRDESSDLPNDYLTAEFDVADSEGRVWSLNSRFPSEILLIHMMDLSSPSSAIAAMSDGDIAAFDKDLLLKDVRFSSDDRFYRRFEAGTRMVDVQFYYTTISFDLAFCRNDRHPILSTLKVRLNEDSLVDAEGESLGPLAFDLNWLYLFRHNIAPAGPGQSVSPFPLPMTFRSTGDRAEPQSGVRLLDSEARPSG